MTDEELQLIVLARAFALRVHAGQFRGGQKRYPFIVHPAEVAALVKKSGGTPAEIAAAWLHDIVEDTPTTLGEIVMRFGVEVSNIVDGLTDPRAFSDLPLPERKMQQARRVIYESDSVKRIKMADQISNVRLLALNPPLDFNRKTCLTYSIGAALVVGACAEVSKFLETKFTEAYKLLIEAYS